MKPVYVTEDGQYEVISLSYSDEAISQITYRNDDGELVFVDDVNAIFKHQDNKEDDLQNSVMWDGKNDEVIAKISQMIEIKTKEHNELAHEIVECEDGCISRKRRDEYYELAGSVATLYEIMKVVE